MISFSFLVFFSDYVSMCFLRFNISFFLNSVLLLYYSSL